MKIRNGFVSNSSSSSFIVGFPKLPEDVEHLEWMMFKETGEIKLYDGIEGTPTIDVAKRVFADMSAGDWKTNRITTKKKALDVILEGSFPGEPKYDWKKTKESEKIADSYEESTGIDINDKNADPDVVKLYNKTLNKEWAEDKKLRETAAKAFLEGFWPWLKGQKVFKFEYSDNSGEANLEHGNIFRNLFHVRISKH